MGGMNVTDITKETIPLSMSTVRQSRLAKGFNLLTWGCVSERTTLPGRAVHSDIRELGKGCVSARTTLPGRAVHSDVRELGKGCVREVVTDSCHFVVHSGWDQNKSKTNMPASFQTQAKNTTGCFSLTQHIKRTISRWSVRNTSVLFSQDTLQEKISQFLLLLLLLMLFLLLPYLSNSCFLSCPFVECKRLLYDTCTLFCLPLSI